MTLPEALSQLKEKYGFEDISADLSEIDPVTQSHTYRIHLHMHQINLYRARIARFGENYFYNRGRMTASSLFNPNVHMNLWQDTLNISGCYPLVDAVLSSVFFER